MVKVAGAFYTESEGGLGTGATMQSASQRLNWFAVYLDDARVLLRALSADGLPTLISKVVPAQVFFADYTPDEAVYTQTLLPLLEGLRSKLAEDGALEGGELAVFKALRLEEEYRPGGEDAQGLVRAMLENLPDYGALSQTYRHMSNIESISSRKSGEYEHAIRLYNALLRDNPHDEHVFFNMARVYYDAQDFQTCRKYLHLLLESDPEMEEAQAFLRHLDKKHPQETPEARAQLRYQFTTPQACVVERKGEEFEAEVLDLSSSGVKVRFSGSGGPSALARGEAVSLRGGTPLLAPLLEGALVQVMWTGGGSFGAMFAAPLDSKSFEFKRLAAYSCVI